MKKIKINGTEYEYQVFLSDGEIHGDFTRFYLGEERYFQRKYLFFGPKILKIMPKIVFTVSFDIESIMLTKSRVKMRLEEAESKYQELLLRPTQIANGEII